MHKKLPPKEKKINTKKILQYTIYIAVCAITFVFAFNFAAFYGIANMPDKAQINIENMFASKNIYCNESKDAHLDLIKKTIISKDTNLQNKSPHNICLLPDSNYDIFTAPDGTIYITEGLYKHIKDKEVFAFLLAHELGHYSARDHLKVLSGKIGLALIQSPVTINIKHQTTAFDKIPSMSPQEYPQEWENNADSYAGKMMYKMYNTNKAGKKFLELIEKEEDMNEFSQYVSRHPSFKIRKRTITRL